MRTGTTVSSIRRSVASRRLVELSFHAIRLAFVYPCVYVYLCVSEYPLVYSSYTFSAQLLYYSLLRIGITRRAAISFLATIRMHHLRDILRRYRLATCPSAYFLLSPSPAPRTPTPSSAILPFLRPLSDNYRDLFRNRISLFPSGLGLFAVRTSPFSDASPFSLLGTETWNSFRVSGADSPSRSNREPTEEERTVIYSETTPTGRELAH